MSDETTAEQPSGGIRLYAFGSWAQQELPQCADATPLGQRLIDYFTGKYTGPLSERESELVLEEFRAQEQYRARLQSEIQKCAAALHQLGAAQAQQIGGPYRVSGGYHSGYELGKYMAYADAAQQIQNAINATSIATHEANERLTAERKAKLAAEGGG